MSKQDNFVESESAREGVSAITRVFEEAAPYNTKDYAESLSVNPPSQSSSVDLECAGFALNDYGNALRMRERFADWLFFGANGGWYGWNESFWDSTSDDGLGLDYARRQLESFKQEYQALVLQGPRETETEEAHAKRLERFFSFSTASGNIQRTKAMVEHAKRVMLGHDLSALDTHHFHFNTKNSMLLVGRDGVEKFDPDKKLLLTKCSVVDYDANADCPRFVEFIDSVFPDPGVRGYVHRMLGYMLTGSTAEQKLFIWLGKGRNGKTTLLNILRHILGSYCKTLPYASFILKGNGASEMRPAMSELPGRRLVAVSEVDYTAPLSSSLVKELTGDDLITGRQLFNNKFFEYRLQGKLVLCANGFPKLSHLDDAMWARIVVVPFDRTFQSTEIDPGLFRALQAEASGILNWLLAGASKWINDGLVVPSRMSAVIDNYRCKDNPALAFFKTNIGLAEDPTANLSMSSLYDKFVQWCEGGGLVPLPSRSFARFMRSQGVVVAKKSGNTFYVGIELRQGWRDE